MGEEIELKLDIAPGALGQLLKSEALKTRGLRFRAARSLVTTYFDTPKSALRAKNIFLRVRIQGRRIVQTVKTAGEGGALAHRGEWNWPLKTAEPDLALAAATGLKALTKRARKNDLVPRFASEIARRVALYSDGETVLELALDQGAVRAGRRTAPIHELEIEVKSGPTAPLFALARELVAVPGIRVAFATKAGLGFALAENRSADAVRAAPLKLTPEMSASAAAAAILDSCAFQAGENLPLLAARRMPEAAHQTRVAMRRLRAGLGLLQEVLPQATGKRLRKQAGKLAEALADARGYDVLVEETLAGAAAPPAPEPDLAILQRRLAGARRTAWRHAVEAATAPQASLLLLDLAEAAALLRAAPAAPDAPSLLDFARTQLEARLEHVLLLAQNLDALGIDDRHRLRLGLKRLRYSVDFFEALFPKKAMKPTLKTLSRLQDALGAFNDAASAPLLIDAAIAHAPKKDAAALARAALFVAGWAAHQSERDWTKAKSLWADFAATEPFWRTGL